MTKGDVYAAFLLVNAIMYATMFARCCIALWRNHLQRHVRYLMWGAAFYTLWQFHDAATRFVGRTIQHVTGVVANQANAEYALFSMGMATLGVFVLAASLEYSAHVGVVTVGDNKREDDPQ